MSQAEIQAIINRTIAANPGISVAQVQTIVNDALASLPASATPDQVSSAVAAATTSLSSSIAGLSADTKAQFDALTNEQKQLALDLAQRTGSLETAINDVTKSTATAIADVKTDIAGVKTDISGVQTNVNNLKAEIGNRIDTLSRTTADADTLLRGSIDSVAEDLGVTRDSLLATLGTTEANLKTEFTGKLEASQKAVLDAIALQSAAQEKAALEASKQSAEQARQQRIATGTAAALGALSFSGFGGQTEFLKPGVVSSKTLAQTPYNLLGPLSQAVKETETEGAPSPAPVETQDGASRFDRLGGGMPAYTYGAETNFRDIFPDFQVNLQEVFNPELFGFAKGGRASNIQMMYAQGGRQDHRQGKHVEGPGDGQSDDIPAWLADGEFVFPADVVSALGNGSTKAGTLKLYQMMHNIRKRARSTGHKDLPPAALKSPLDYLRSKQ